MTAGIYSGTKMAEPRLEESSKAGSLRKLAVYQLALAQQTRPFQKITPIPILVGMK
jgi:hypothetical protein